MRTMRTKAKTILFVDDDPWYSRRMLEELEDAGYRVRFVSSSGTEALEMLESGIAVDLIVLDIMMPPGHRIDDPTGGRRTGVRLYEHIRRDMRLSVPIVFFTVVEDQQVHSYIEQVGREVGLGSVILVKPVAPLELVEKVRELIGEPERLL